MDFNFRSLLPSDEPFLWEMLYLALYVPPGNPSFPRSILEEPDIACYVQGWGRSGDWGLMVNTDAEQVGAIWLRQWNGDEKGYGFVSPDIPELSLALLPDYRNMGLGTWLLNQVIAAASGRFAALSLSVVETSPARRLYERLGFTKVGKVMDSLVMLLTLEGAQGDLPPGFLSAPRP